MEKWEMTFKQFCENWLESSKYAAKYKNDSKAWEGHKRSVLYPKWEQILLERAEVGSIPSDVLMSFIRLNDENYLYRLFKGVYQKGIQDFKIPKSVRDLRKDQTA